MIRIFLWVAALAGIAAAQSVSGLGEGILQESSLARQAVADHNQSAALDHVKQAQANAQAIERQMPPDSPVLVPVSREVDTTTTYRNVKPGKGDEFRLKHDTSVRGVEGVVTTSHLNVSAAGASLETARAALEHADWATAGIALDAVSESVMKSQRVGDMPLTMAAQNLQLARDRVASGKYRDAEVPLRSAAEALSKYERTAPERAGAVESLRGQIAECAQSIAHHHEDALARIEAWSNSIDDWRR